MKFTDRYEEMFRRIFWADGNTEATSATFLFGLIHLRRIDMKKLAFIFAVPVLFCVVGFQGSCHSQCQELRQELIKDCRADLGPNSERCREDQKKFQEMCHDESLDQ